MTELGRIDMEPAAPDEPVSIQIGADEQPRVSVGTSRSGPSTTRTAPAASRRDRTRLIDSVLVGSIVAVTATLVEASIAPAVLIAVLLTVVWGGTARLYGDLSTRGDAWRRGAATATGVSLGLVLASPQAWGDNRLILVGTAAAAMVALVSHRELARLIDTPLFGTARSEARTLLIGDPDSVAEFERLTDGATGLQVEGRLEVDTTSTDVRAPMRAADEAVALCEQLNIERVVLVASAPGYPAVKSIVRRLTLRGVGVELVTGAASISPGRLSAGHLGDFATVRVRGGLDGRRRRLVKRGFDVLVAGTLLLLAAPLMAIVAVAIKMDSPGAALYRQHRLGKKGQQFAMLKFRSMVDNAESKIIDLTDENGADGPLFKMKQDPRITGVGRVLRRLSIDELPQLINVLRGDMSLVGPRPALPSEADGWTPELFDRLEVSPGVTGPWQVSGRSDASFADYGRLDLYYIDNWSLGLDINILLRTIPAIVRGTGAY